MDIIEILKTEHESVQDLMEKIEVSSERASKTREQTYSKLKAVILQHMYGEENTFYPFLLETVEEKDLIFEAFEEHRVVRLALPDVDSTAVDDEQWLPKFKVVAEMIRHHIQQEESNVFDLARDVLNEEKSDKIASDFEKIKKEAKLTV